MTTELIKIMLAVWGGEDCGYRVAGDGKRDLKLSSIENQELVFKTDTSRSGKVSILFRANGNKCKL